LTISTNLAQQITSLSETFPGDVITPDDARYDQARRVWNGMIDRHPAAVLRPTTPDAVATAVRFGRDNDVTIAVRSGGHSAAGLSTCDDGIVIDMSAMRGVTVDPGARTARSNGGALLAELDVAAMAYDLVCPVGVVGHTGVAGLTLGGGMGRLQRMFGLTIDNLLAVELVTADGRHVRASEDENRELFWAMRGAGANFGIVTAFEFRLHPMVQTVTRGSWIYPASQIAELWPAFRDFSEHAPDRLHIALNIGYGDPGDDQPDSISAVPTVTIGFTHAGDPGQVDADIAPLRELPPAALESQGQVSYLEMQTSMDADQSWGHRYYNKGGFIDDLPLDAIQRIVDHVADGRGLGSWGLWTQGGQMGRVDDDATAFTGRSALFDMSGDSQWDHSAQDDERLAWVRQVMAIAEPYAVTGRYVNEASDTGEDVTRSIYGTEKMDRLVAVKRAWDPGNVFRMNQNIKP
jgi:FAD/FMN-containing dehydrogenase